MRFAKYLLKNIWRHRTRSMLTIGGAAVGIFVYYFLCSLQDGMHQLTEGAQNNRSLIVFQANRYCPSTSRLHEEYARTISKMSGVQDVMPVKVYTNNCRASLDVIVFHGVPAEKIQTFRDLKLISGDWDLFLKRKDAAVVGSAIAKRRRLTQGSKFTVGEISVTVAGIFESQIPADESFVYTHLDFLQRSRGMASEGSVTQFEVRLNEDADAESVCRAIDERFRNGPISTDSKPKGAFQASVAGDIVELIDFSGYLGLACVALVFGIVSTTSAMTVQDRFKEFAVLQAMGYTAGRIFRFIVVESLIVSQIGGVLAILAATFMLWWTQLAVGTEGVLIAFQPSHLIAGKSMLVSFVVGALASLFPAWSAARLDIANTIKAQ